MKFLYYIAIILGISSLNAKAVYPDPIASNINLEIINKSDAPIALYISGLNRKGDYYLIHAKSNELETNAKTVAGTGYLKILPKETFAAQVSVNAPTDIQIGVWESTKGSGSAAQYPTKVEKYKINAPGKTRLLSYKRSNALGERLYPQTGPLMGLVKSTNSGLTRKNNLEATDVLYQVQQ